MLKGLIGSVIAVGLSSSPLINKPIDNSLVSPNTQAVSYDDNDYLINFNSVDLDIQYNNLCTYLIDTYSNQELVCSMAVSVNYNNSIIDYDYASAYYQEPPQAQTYELNSYHYKEGASLEEINVILMASQEREKYGYFYAIDPNGEVNTDDIILNSLVLSFTSSEPYLSFKNAVELDIQANQPAENNMPSVTDLFGYITQGVNAFIGSLGQAFESVVALFWDSTATTPAPTFLGLLMLISIGAGLIFLAYRVIKRLVYRVRG